MHQNVGQEGQEKADAVPGHPGGEESVLLAQAVHALGRGE